MNNIFVSHYRFQNQIDIDYATSSLIYIVGILFLCFLCSLRKKHEFQHTHEAWPTIETTITLRGIAVLGVIFGHFSFMCVDGISPFENIGEPAVTIFLFVSGVGLTKKYGISRLKAVFFYRRLRRLVVPLWITLVLFYSLDYLILHRTHSLAKIILSFVTILNQKPPNAVSWFVTYILFLYTIYFFVSHLKSSVHVKVGCIFLFSYLAIILIEHVAILNQLRIWTKFPVVFPVAVFIGVHRKTVYQNLESLYQRSVMVYTLVLTIFLGLFISNFGINILQQSLKPGTASLVISTFRHVYSIGFIMMFGHILEKIHYRSALLQFLGKYSFEIYLLHLPFMAYYDVFLFRKPLVFFFFLYGLFIVLLSLWLNVTSKALARFLFRG